MKKLIAVAAHAAAMMAFSAALALNAAAQQAAKTPAASPQAKTATPPAASNGSQQVDSVVMKVNQKEVKKSDLAYVLSTLSPQAQQALVKQGRRSFGDQYATMLVLDQQAKASHLETTKPYLQEMEQHGRQVLAQLELQNLASNVPVTPAEISQYYDAHRADFQQAQVREVAIRVRPQGAASSAAGFTPAEAQAKSEAIRKALASGEDPKKVASDFSIPNEVIIDADPRTIQNSSNLPDFAKSAFTLSSGALSPVQQTANALVFFQVINHNQVDLKSATPQIENALRQQKVNDLVQGLVKKANVWMDEAFFGSATSNASKPAAGQPETGSGAATPTNPGSNR